MDLHIEYHIVRDKWPTPPESYNAFIDPYYQDTIDISFQAPYSLPRQIAPGERWLCSTIEKVSVPAGFIGQICLRSTFARLGLLAPPTIADPGFRGYLTMEIFNANVRPILIRPGDILWNFTFASAPLEPLYEGRYQDQPVGVALPKALKMVDYYEHTSDPTGPMRS